MRTIASFRDLDQLGINPLTGESCAYAMRILCDLNEYGLILVREFLGLPPDCPFEKNWNSTVGKEPALASVMLTHGVLPDLVRYALYREGHQYVIASREEVFGVGFSEADFDEHPGLRHYLDPERRYLGRPDAQLWRNPGATSTHPRVGGRNVHAFTGRST